MTFAEFKKTFNLERYSIIINGDSNYSGMYTASDSTDEYDPYVVSRIGPRDCASFKIELMVPPELKICDLGLTSSDKSKLIKSNGISTVQELLSLSTIDFLTLKGVINNNTRRRIITAVHEKYFKFNGEIEKLFEEGKI